VAGSRLLFGAHCHAVPTVEHDRRVIWVPDGTPGEHLQDAPVPVPVRVPYSHSAAPICELEHVPTTSRAPIAANRRVSTSFDTLVLPSCRQVSMETHSPADAAPLRPSPARGGSMQQARRPTRFRWPAGMSSALLSMPLAYPSTLDRRSPRSGLRPTWRGFGARASRTGRKIRRQKLTLLPSVFF
jgi:hypothetical protein